MKIIFIGSGGHFNVLHDLVKLKKLKIIGICDILKIENHPIYKYQFVSEKELLSYNPKNICLVNAIGFDPNNDNRKRTFLKFKKLGFNFLTLIHPSVIISKTAIIGEGSQILSQSCILPNVKVGDNCIINTKTSVDHDSIIEDNVNLSPNVTICGNVIVKKETYVGASVTILNNINVGKNCHIFPGSIVNKNIKNNFNYTNGRVYKS